MRFDCRMAWLNEVGHIEYSDTFEIRCNVVLGSAMLVMGLAAMGANECLAGRLWEEKEGGAVQGVTDSFSYCPTLFWRLKKWVLTNIPQIAPSSNTLFPHSSPYPKAIDIRSGRLHNLLHPRLRYPATGPYHSNLYDVYESYSQETLATLHPFGHGRYGAILCDRHMLRISGNHDR